ALWRRHDASMSGSDQARTLAEVDAMLARLRLAFANVAQLVAQVHGVEVPEQIRQLWEGKETRHWLLIKAFLEGRKLGRAEIDSQRKWLWQLMFALPRPLAGYLYRWWWGYRTGPLKRWLRELLQQPQH